MYPDVHADAGQPLPTPNDRSFALTGHSHGKERVRVARVWRELPSPTAALSDGLHHFREWEVSAIIDSAMEHAFLSDSNAGMTPTDTIKNIVYSVAKRQARPCGPEHLAAQIAEELANWAPAIQRAVIHVDQKAWARASVVGGGADPRPGAPASLAAAAASARLADPTGAFFSAEAAALAPRGEPHAHGFELATGIRWARAVAYRGGGEATVEAGGIRGLSLLKTTQSGYAGYARCRLTSLPESAERILATALDAEWRWRLGQTPDWEGDARAVTTSLVGAFFGPAHGGTFSPSVQRTLYLMGQAALVAAPGLESVTLAAPNLHFLPLHAPALGMPFANDIFVPTSEPHGQIRAVVTRTAARL